MFNAQCSMINAQKKQWYQILKIEHWELNIENSGAVFPKCSTINVQWSTHKETAVLNIEYWALRIEYWEFRRCFPKCSTINVQWSTHKETAVLNIEYWALRIEYWEFRRCFSQMFNDQCSMINAQKSGGTKYWKLKIENLGAAFPKFSTISVQWSTHKEAAVLNIEYWALNIALLLYAHGYLSWSICLGRIRSFRPDMNLIDKGPDNPATNLRCLFHG